MGKEWDDGNRPAGHVIVGKVTDRSAIIWVKGAPGYKSATLRLRTGEAIHRLDADPVDLDPSGDNTAVAKFDGLIAGRRYEVTAVFRSAYGLDTKHLAGRRVRATFRTAPAVEKGQPTAFSFLLGSCNLSVVTINNQAAQFLQMGGIYAATRSLRRPVDQDQPLPRPTEKFRNVFGRWWMRRRWRRWLIDLALQGSIGAIFVGTGGKWPHQPVLRSPFLKLEALFDGYAIHYRPDQARPNLGQEIRGSVSGAVGILAFAPIPVPRQRPKVADDDASPAPTPDDTAKEPPEAALILVQVQGAFTPGDRLVVAPRDKKVYLPMERETVGYVIDAVRVTSDYDEPEFAIHAGDQIYFDVPDAKRQPRVERYHEAYREAWFDDRHQRAFLARGAHLMTLDDHEIVDQFAIDQEWQEGKKLPDGYTADDFTAARYRDEAMAAYRHYVQARHGSDKVYFHVDYGHARFFFLDTRTERRRRPDATMNDPDTDTRMIDRDQMEALKAWLELNADAPKFVVSSIPFVAEVVPDPGKVGIDGKPGRAADKWAGPAYRLQREEIIDFIDEKRIDKLVFLVGDMHCAYHASMAVGDGRRWERRRIHELAGGPINQLQHGRRHEFATAVRARTRGGKTVYDIRLHQFHTGANAVMHIKLDTVRDEHLQEDVPEVYWRVIRTMTPFDSGPWFNDKEREKGRIEDQPPISGRIAMRGSANGRGQEGRAA